MDRFMYADILKSNILPYNKRNMPSKGHFQQNNDPKHKSKFINDWHKSQGTSGQAKVRILNP